MMRINPRIEFVLKFTGITLGLFTLFFFTRNSLKFLLSGTAWILKGLLFIFGINSKVVGWTIVFPNVNFSVIYACTAIFPIIIFIAAIMSYKAELKSKGLAILVGVPLIYLLNLLRLLVLSLVGMKFPSAFQFIHSFLWESIFLIFIILMFVFWVKKYAKE